MDKFWRWVKNQGEQQVRTLYLEGYIAEYSWYDDDVTPKQFKTELYEGKFNDDIIVKIHSPGGDCFAAAQIYNMLQEYPGKVTVHIDGLAASAASVIAMAGDEIYVSPLSIIMVHNPAMFVGGEASDLEVGINLLNEVKESIINAYEKKTKLSRVKISHMMNSETWMSAQKAIDLNFADHILYEDEATENVFNSFMFDKLTVTNALRDKLPGIKTRMSEIVVTGSKETHEVDLVNVPEAKEPDVKEDIVKEPDVNVSNVKGSEVKEDIVNVPEVKEPDVKSTIVTSKPKEIKEPKETQQVVDLEGHVSVIQLEKRLKLIKNWR